MWPDCAPPCRFRCISSSLWASSLRTVTSNGGLDYWPHVDMAVWPNLDAYIRNAGAGRRLVLTSARRGAALHRFEFTENDSLVFGRETSGLPPEVIALSPHHVRIPIKGEVRSINLSTAAGIVLFQALVSAGMVGE